MGSSGIQWNFLLTNMISMPGTMRIETCLLCMVLLKDFEVSALKSLVSGFMGEERRCQSVMETDVHCFPSLSSLNSSIVRPDVLKCKH